jgi:hypothetical protein
MAFLAGLKMRARMKLSTGDPPDLVVFAASGRIFKGFKELPF